MMRTLGKHKHNQLKQMIKKKIVMQPAAKPTGKLPTKLQRPAAPVEEVEEDEDYLEDDTEEEDTVEETKATKASAPKSSGPRKLSRAEAFNAISVSGNADQIEAGRYEAVITSVVLQEPDLKGQSIRWNFELCDPDLGENNKIVTWNKLFWADNSPCIPGIKILKVSLAKIGYEDVQIDPDDEELQKLRTVAEEITDSEERIGVLLNISYNKGKDGVTYQRVMIDAASDNDMVQAYRDRIPY